MIGLIGVRLLRIRGNPDEPRIDHAAGILKCGTELQVGIRMRRLVILKRVLIDVLGVVPKDKSIEFRRRMRSHQFRHDVRRNMDKEVESRIKAEIKRQVMEQLLEANPIELPAVLVEQEATSLRNDSMRNLGITDPQNPQARDLDAFREVAERRVRLSLLVSAVIAENKLEADRDSVKLKVDEICAPYDEPGEIRKLYYQNPKLLAQVENLVMEEHVVDWLVSKAAVSDKITGFKELMNTQ